MMQFTKATKEKSKLRLAIFGPSGSGKTFTSLRMATGIGGQIAVIDSERGRASKYADRFDFDVLELDKKDITTYTEAIKAAEGYSILIIDSLSHAWYELLGEMDKVAKSRFGGNKWSAWSEGTPKQREFIDILLGYPGHIIATMRTKTEWTLETDERGRTKPVRIGLAPEQGKGIEYEFDLLMELNPEHTGKITKDTTGKFQDASIDLPGEEFGQELSAWLEQGIVLETKIKRPEPAKSGNGQRPYSPDVLKAKIHEAATHYQGKKATDIDRKVIAKALTTTFEGSDTKRYEFSKWLTGVASTKEMADSIVLAIKNKWLGVADFEDAPSEHAIQEAKAALDVALMAAGQQTLL